MIPKIRVLIADDHAIFRESLHSHLNTLGNIEVVGEAADGIEAVDLAGRLNPDIVLMDYSMPNLNGLVATQQIKKRYPSIKILILTMFESGPHIQQVLAAGASGYITKKAPTQELTSAISAIYNGEAFLCPTAAKYLLEDYSTKVKELESKTQLTARETELLSLVAEGKSNKEISKLLNISINTVQVHRMNLMKKLDVHDRTQIVRYAIRKGLIIP